MWFKLCKVLYTCKWKKTQHMYVMHQYAISDSSVTRIRLHLFYFLLCAFLEISYFIWGWAVRSFFYLTVCDLQMSISQYWASVISMSYLCNKKLVLGCLFKKLSSWDTWVAQWLSICLRPRVWSRVLRLSPALGFLHGAGFSLYLCLCLFFLSWISK